MVGEELRYKLTLECVYKFDLVITFKLQLLNVLLLHDSVLLFLLQKSLSIVLFAWRKFHRGSILIKSIFNFFSTGKVKNWWWHHRCQFFIRDIRNCHTGPALEGSSIMRLNVFQVNILLGPLSFFRPQDRYSKIASALHNFGYIKSNEIMTKALREWITWFN